jgi:hypothetical protein
MLIVYDKTTHAIVGHCSRVFDSGKWREPVIEEIFPDRDLSNLGSINVGEDAAFIAYGAGAWRLKTDDTGLVTGIERLPVLFVTCDAGDSDKDGVPDLPADGKAVAIITARTSDGSDTPVTFRTTRGALDQRTAQTKGGVATVNLRAATETVALTVTATAEGYRPGRLDMELTPEAAPHPTPPPKSASRRKKAAPAA